MVEMGVNLGAGLPLGLSYDSQRAPWGGQATALDGEATVYGDLGKLWSSSLHRTLALNPNGQNIQAIRGGGTVASFNGSGSSWVTTLDNKDSLSVKDGNYVYRDQSARSLEVYDMGTLVGRRGLLQYITQSNGMKWVTANSTGSSAAAPAAGYMLSLSDPFGRSVGFTYKKVSTPDGDQVVIDQITALDKRSITAGYDANANLTSLTWQDGSIKAFVYDSPNANQTWALTGVIDEAQKRYATFSYDPTGWAKSTQHNIGANAVYAFTASYDSAPQPVIREIPDLDANVIWRCHEWAAPLNTKVAQPNGGYLGMNFYTILGDPKANGAGKCNMLRFAGYSQQAGAGCGEATSNVSYDSNANVKSYDDFNGHRTCYKPTTTADGLANLEKVRVEGLDGGSKGTSCDGVLADGAALPKAADGTLARKISTAWHPQWALKTQQAEPLRKTTWVYNGQPDPFNNNQVASCASVTANYGTSSSATLPDGSPIAVLCKKVEQATDDPDGSLGLNAPVSTVDAGAVSQRQWSYTYNQYGQVLTSIDPLGATTRYSYYPDTSFTGSAPNEQGHTQGDLQSVTNALGHTTSYTLYDRAGRVLSMSDPNGLVSTYSYWPRGWIKSVNVGGLTSNFDYWPTGLLKKATQPDGSYLYYVYDDAHRLTDITDQVDGSGTLTGNRVHYTLDNAGNRLGEDVKDGNGALMRTIARTYDALNRLSTITGAQQ